MGKRNASGRPGGRRTSSGSSDNSRRSSSPRKRNDDSRDQKRSSSSGPKRSGKPRESRDEKPWAKRDTGSDKKPRFDKEEKSKFTRTSSPRSSGPRKEGRFGRDEGTKKFDRSSSRGDGDNQYSSRPSRSFGKRDGDDRKPKFAKGDGEKDFKKSSRSFGDRDNKSGSRSAKPVGKRDDQRDERKPRFGKSEGDREFKKSSGTFSDRNTRSESRSSKPFTRRDDERKPRFAKDDGEKGVRKSSRYSEGSDNRSSSRSAKPFTKRDDQRDERKPRFGKRDDERDERRPRLRKDADDSRTSSPKSKFGSDDRDFKKGKGKPFKATPAEHDSKPPVQTGQIRLNRYIANSGLCSRREADEYITMGLISVNGKTITELGYKVNPTDEVRHENRVLRAEKNVYILMNKPKGYLTTTVDPQERNTVMHIIGDHVRERIYPVGRLDRNTTGLLLLTNDGELADKLMHPSYNVKKIYKVDLDRPLTRADLQKLQEGVHLEEGKAQVDDVAIVSEDGKTVGVELHIGWNRVVRRIFETLGYEVVKLDRSVYAGLDKKDLPRGHWRHLKKEEIVRLKHFK
jgi:23S rRNA pseudouridine2605 synthase